MRNRRRGALVTTAVASYFVDLVYKKIYGAKTIFEKKKKFSPTSTAFKQRYFSFPLLNFASTPMVRKRVSSKILFRS